MVKCTSRKLKGLQQGLERHKVCLNRHHDEQPASVFSAETAKKIEKVAAQIWWSTLELTSLCFLIPIEIEEGSGFARPAPLWKRLIHFAIALFYFIIMMYKLVLAGHRASVTLDMITYMSACQFMAIFIPAAATIGTTVLSTRFCALLNSWQRLLKVLDSKAGKRQSVFDNAVGPKVILVYLIGFIGGTNTPLYSLVLELPNCVLPTLTNAGLIRPSPVLPIIVWRFLFLPLEILTLLPPMLLAAVLGMTTVLAVGIFNLCAEVARDKNIRNVQNWEEVYSLYRTMQVYNAILMNWLKTVSVVAPFSVCCGVILVLYITIRPSDIPPLLYPFLPLLAVMTMTMTNFLITDAVHVKRKADDVISNLQTALYNQSVRRFDVVERKACFRRLKSLRPVSLRIGEFAEPSFAVTMNVWDEVFNQVVLLLSL